jgi:predicted metal-dependent hydrolase
LKRFLISHADKISWVNQTAEIEPQITAWLEENLPKFQDEYKAVLYHYEEIQKYIQNLPKRETSKSVAISALREFKREQISSMINERLAYVQSKLRVLETHFVSGVSGASQRTQATPRKDEFKAVSVDIFLK